MGEESRVLPSQTREQAVPARPALPSWPSVLRTTIRLWGQRRMRSMARHKWQVIAVAAVVVVVASAIAVAVGAGVAGHPAAAHRLARRHAPASVSAVGPAAASAMAAAARWIAGQVSPQSTVACDPRMCTVLRDAGIPAAELVTLGPGAAGPAGATLIVSTAAIRHQLGAQLSGGDAPTVLASFGSGPAQVEVRVAVSAGPAAYLAALRRDLRARRAAGRLLLRTGHVTAAGITRRDLASGLVDSRLLVTLAALASRYYLKVATFTDAGPGAGPRVPFRAAELARVASVPARDGLRYLRSLLVFVRHGHAHIRPSSAAIVRLASGRRVLRIAFPAPSPLGLLAHRAAREIMSRA